MNAAADTRAPDQQRFGRVLVVEDDADLLDVMTGALTADGHAVAAASNADQALDLLVEQPFDLVLLDIGLGPGPDGIDVCRRLRAAGMDAVHVLVLTARDSEADVVMALEAGADDYVTKPIGVAELRSRVRAVMRRLRPAETRGGELRSGDLRLDPDARLVRVGDVALHLTYSEFEVLHALMAAEGSLRSRQELLFAIFGDDAFRDPRAIDVHVHHLREKIGASAGDPELIVTVRGAGYRLGA
ncbi:MAG TPA: response regulator transcription factor [Solirubrobacteraceae bacterium]|nr:response regulator transcription factor [Solirubrobacteraceae bacterium]